ncbi:MAG: PH domain-containing protein [Bacteroidota bacterium]
MKEFKSKVGYEILIPTLLLLIVIMLLPIINGAPLAAIITMVVIILVIAAFILHLFFQTSYFINERDELLIKAGSIFKSPVNISTIESVTKTRSPTSSPAPSMDRLKLTFGKSDPVIISPKDKIGFVRELRKINPSIKSKPE